MLLSELNLNPPGGDNDKEFIEYRSSTSQAMSTNGYTLLLLDVDGSRHRHHPRSMDARRAGHGRQRPAPHRDRLHYFHPATEGGAPAAATELGAPAGMDPDDIGGATNNGATSLLLVRYFTGKVGEGYRRRHPGRHRPTTAPWTTCRGAARWSTR